MTEPVEFRGEITLTKDEVLDLVARPHEVLAWPGESGQVDIGFAVEGVRRFLLGRLTTTISPGTFDGRVIDTKEKMLEFLAEMERALDEGRSLDPLDDQP